MPLQSPPHCGTLVKICVCLVPEQRADLAQYLLVMKYIAQGLLQLCYP